MRNLSKDGSVHVTDETVNTATHMAAAVFAFFGAVLLIGLALQQDKWLHATAFTIYGFSLVALFVMSALHHGVEGSEKVNRRLRTLDYVAVYALIAGTIVPVCLVLYRNTVAGYAVLFATLAVLAFGITMRSVYRNLPSYISLTLYMCLGWLPALLILLEPV